MEQIAYSGWIGHNNIGDEALYLATEQLLDDVELIDANHLSEYEVFILGGGTLLPRQATDLKLRAKDLNIAIGVGARDPQFWNQRFSRLDLGYYLGRTGYYDHLQNKVLRYLSRPITQLTDEVRLDDHYLTDEMFESVSDFDFDYLGVRGPNTHRLLSKYNIEHEVVGDTALALEPSSYYSEPQKRIAITLRDGGYSWSTEGDHIDIVLDFCRKYSNNFEFIFIPFFPPDIELHRQAASEIPNAVFRDYCSFVDVKAVLDEIARCDLVIADKLHANVLSACARTPFISLEYRPKNRDFAESVDMGAFNLRSDHLTPELLEKKAMQAVHNRDLIRQLRSNVAEKRASLEIFTRRITAQL